MARIDKVVQIVRGIAGTAFPGGTVTPVAVSAGSVVVAGSADAIGVVCPGGTIPAGDAIGVLIRGEIVEFGGSAATTYYGGSAGMGTASGATVVAVGFTIEADRLVVTM